MTDSYVQVATDGTGKKIDNSALQRERPDPAWDSTDGDLVYRQRVVISSDNDETMTLDLKGEVGEAQMPVASNSLDRIAEAVEEIRDILKICLS